MATLIREHQGAAAAKMVSTLSDFLRATLHTANLPEISVSEELVFVDQYVELQQLRFADRLRVSIEADEETYSALLPTLILQPLVENAVQHGVLPRERGGSDVRCRPRQYDGTASRALRGRCCPDDRAVGLGGVLRCRAAPVSSI